MGECCMIAAILFMAISVALAGNCLFALFLNRFTAGNTIVALFFPVSLHALRLFVARHALCDGVRRLHVLLAIRAEKRAKRWQISWRKNSLWRFWVIQGFDSCCALCVWWNATRNKTGVDFVQKSLHSKILVENVMKFLSKNLLIKMCFTFIN